MSSLSGFQSTRPQSTRPQNNSAPKTTRPQVNSAPLPTRPQGQLVPSQLGPKFKCKTLIIVYSNFNATKHKTCSTGSIVQNSVVSRPNSRSSTLLLFTCTILQMQWPRYFVKCQCKPTTYNTVQRARLMMGGVAFSIMRRGLGGHVLLADLVWPLSSVSRWAAI